MSLALDQALPGDMPITLVIKAPNQRMADQTVECMLGWTIRKLKQHLETVYPSKPKHNEQRLIYSGKLLQDHLTLKEVLRQYEGCEQPTKHTVHLVCSPSSESSYAAKASSIPKKPSVQEPVPERPTSTNTTASANQPQNVPTSSSQSDTDGVRFRGNATNTTVPPQSFANGYSQSAFTGNYGAQGYAAYPGNQTAYSPDQYNWYMQQQQQAYTQYMMQYMQYYQSLYYPGQAFDPQAMAYMQQQQLPTPTMQQPQQPRAEQAQAAAPLPNNAGNDMPRMNAQGGMDDDDNDDLEPRDWLHHVYFFMRCLTFLGLLFFYSNVTRFLLVFFGTVVIYFLQKVKRHMQRAQQAQEEERRQQQQQQEQQNPGGEANEGDGANRAERDESQQDAAREPEPTNEAQREREEGSHQDAPQPAQEREEEGHWAARAFMFFFMTVQAFFTSLLPTPPELLEAN